MNEEGNQVTFTKSSNIIKGIELIRLSEAKAKFADTNLIYPRCMDDVLGFVSNDGYGNKHIFQIVTLEGCMLK